MRSETWLRSIALHATQSLPRAPITPANQNRARPQSQHQTVEQLERRTLLSSAIAAFAPQQTFDTGADPRSATVADVNRDGAPDLLVANHDSNSVNVLLGNGDGTFSPQRTFLANAAPYSLTVADVNGDGKPDILVANYASGSLSVLLGNGDGNFHSPVTFAAGTGAYTVVTADFDGDGKLDAAVSDYAANTVSILLGTGTGSFSPPSLQPVGATPSALASADFNRDGKPDLLTTNFTDGTVSLLLGNGNGTFQPQTPIPAGSAPNSLAIGDINSDGKPDVAIANFTAPGSITLLLGNGDGSFQPLKTLATASQPSAIAIADINRDGKMDLAVASFGLDSAAVLLGNGNATFQPQKIFSVVFRNNASYPGSLAVADINSDGRPDLVLANTNVAAVSVLLGDVPPTVLSINRTDPQVQTTLSSTLSFTVTFNEPVTGVDPSDFVTQGFGIYVANPLAVSGSGSQYTVTVSGRSGAGFLGLNLVDDGSIKDAAGNPLQPGGAAKLTPVYGGLGGRDVALGDVNRDGNADMVFTNYNGISVAPGNGDGTFTFGPPQTFANSNVWADSIADMNNDGKPDVVLVELSGQVGVMLGNGDGTFQLPATFAGGAQLVSMSTVDMNGDGKTDVVFCDYISNTVCVMLGNGDGTLSPPSTYLAGVGPNWVATADLNGDGIPDVVASNRYSHSVSVFLGQGNGTLGPATTFAAGPLPNSVAVADCNNDGKLDLFVGDNGDNRPVSLLLGNGNGTFQPAQTVVTDISPQSPALPADINGDGKIDLVIQDEAPSILFGNGDGTFGPAQRYSLPFSDSRSTLAVADLNHDGNADVIDNAIGGGSVYLGANNGNFAGQTYIVPSSNSLSVSGGDQITLRENSDHQHIDWRTASTGSAVAINDANGLAITGTGNNVITLDYTNGNPLPNTLHLNGNFTITGLQGANPFSNTQLEIGQSTIYFSYTPGSTPLAAIQQALKTGYNTGSWNGVATASTGAITSSAAALNRTFSLGYADSSDGTGVNTHSSTVEIKYTLTGDANLNGSADIFDLNALLPHFNSTGAWTSGDFTYNAAVDIFDLNALLPNFNQSLPAASPSAASAPAPTTAPLSTAAAVNAASTNRASSVVVPATPLPDGAPDTTPDDLNPLRPSPRKRHSHQATKGLSKHRLA